MKFLKDVETITTDEVYYDLFDGGYIKPEEILEHVDAQKINDAINHIKNFINEATEEGIIEIF